MKSEDKKLFFELVRFLRAVFYSFSLTICNQLIILNNALGKLEKGTLRLSCSQVSSFKFLDLDEEIERLFGKSIERTKKPVFIRLFL